MAGESLKVELETYARRRDELREHHMGKFVVIHGKELLGAYDTFDNAANAAVSAYGDDPFLIRRVGDRSAMPMPASVAYPVIQGAG